MGIKAVSETHWKNCHVRAEPLLCKGPLLDQGTANYCFSASALNEFRSQSLKQVCFTRNSSSPLQSDAAVVSDHTTGAEADQSHNKNCAKSAEPKPLSWHPRSLVFGWKQDINLFETPGEIAQAGAVPWVLPQHIPTAGYFKRQCFIPEHSEWHRKEISWTVLIIFNSIIVLAESWRHLKLKFWGVH